jgi:hypothetical protein
VMIPVCVSSIGWTGVTELRCKVLFLIPTRGEAEHEVYLMFFALVCRRHINNLILSE